MAGDYTLAQLGDRRDDMEWDGGAWTAICPACDVAMSEYNARAELCCPVCGVSYLERVRGQR